MQRTRKNTTHYEDYNRIRPRNASIKINSRLVTEKENIRESEDIAIETIQNEAYREKKRLKEKKNNIRESCNITSSSLMHM